MSMQSGEFTNRYGKRLKVDVIDSHTTGGLYHTFTIRFPDGRVSFCGGFKRDGGFEVTTHRVADVDHDCRLEINNA